MTGTPPPFNPPSTARETELLFKGMTDQVKNLVLYENARYAEQMGVAGELGEQHAAMQEQARQQQGQMALQEAVGGLLNADFRDMGARDALQEQIAGLAHIGLGAEQIQPLQDFHRDAGQLTDYLAEDTGVVDQYLASAAESGLLPRLLAAFGRGGKAGLMMADRSTRGEVIEDALSQIVEGRLGHRFPEALAEQGAPGEPQFGGGMFGGAGPMTTISSLQQPQETLHGVVSPEQYRHLLGKGVERSIRKHGEGMEEGFLEKVFGGGGHILGMLAPLGATMKGGQLAAQGATGTMRLAGLVRAGVEAPKVAQLGQTIMQLGVANTKFGAALQRWGGGMGALFGVGAAKPLPEQEEARIAALPEERQEAAHKAARIMAGVDLAMTGPMMMLGIKGAHMPGLASRVGGPAAGATAFGVAGEVTGAAQMGMHELAQELSPEFARAVQMQIIADPDLRGPLTQMAEALGQNDYRSAVEAGERLAEEWGAGFVGFGLINLLTAAKQSGRDREMEDVIARVRFQALKETESMSAEAEVVRELKAAVNAKFDALRPSGGEREARRLMEEMGRETGGRARDVIEERQAVERLDIGQAADVTGRRKEVGELLREQSRKASETGKPRDIAESERLEAADEYLRAIEVAGQTHGAGRSEAMLQAETWLEHYQRLGRGEPSEVPGAQAYAEMRQRAPGIEAARELRFEERGMATARAYLAERGKAAEPIAESPEFVGPPVPPEMRVRGIPEVPSHQAAKPEPVPEHGAWGIPQSPEQVGSQVAARVRLGERATALRPVVSSVEQLPRGRSERERGVQELHRGDAFSRDYARDVEEAMRRVPNAGSHRLAAEALYLNLRRAAGEPPPKQTLGREVERLGEEFRVVESVAVDNPGVFLAWARASHPELQGSLGEAMAHYKPGVELTKRMEAFQQKHVFTPANLEQGPYAMGILPFAKEIDGVRNLAMFGDGGVVRSLDAWTKQAAGDLLDPAKLKQWGDIPLGPIRTPTHLLARWTKLFEHPVSEFGDFAIQAGRMTALNQLQVKDLRGWFAGIARKHGITEWTDFKKPEDLKANPDIPAHRVQQLLAETNQSSPIWKTAPENVKAMARELQPMLETLRQAAAESTPWWLRREGMLRASERIQQRGVTRLEELEATRASRMEAGMANAEIAEATQGVERLRGDLKRARERRVSAKGALTKAQKAGKPTEAFEKRLAERAAEVESIEGELRVWNDALRSGYKTAGLESPYKLDSAITAAKQGVSRQVSFQEKTRAQMKDYADKWGIDGYAPNIATVLVDRNNQPRFAAGVKAELRDQPSYGIEMVMTGPARRRTGALEAKGNVDPDIMRSMHAYIGRIVPFIGTQRFLNQFAEKIYGKWDELPQQWRFDGVNPKRKGTDEWNVDIRVDPLAGVEGISSPAPFKQVLGTFHAMESKEGRTFQHVRDADAAAKDAKKFVLAWRGEGQLHRDMLSEADQVETLLKAGNLVAVPEHLATDAIRVRHGGFKQLAHPSRYESLQEYLEVLTRPRSEALGIPVHGPIFESVDKFTRTAAYWMSTQTLGWLNYGSAMNAATGALFINTLMLGPRRASSSMGYWWDFLDRVKRAKLNGDPLEDLAIMRQEGSATAKGAPLEALRMEKYKRVRNGKDPILDDAYEWLLGSGLLSNTRGISWFDKTRPFQSALEPTAWDRKTGDVTKWKRNFATKPSNAWEATKEKGSAAVEAGWSFFGSDPSAPFAHFGFEGAVRVSLAVDAYVAARRKGRSAKDAENLASRAVILAHGMFNPALRSRFFRAGPGQMIGTVNAWATQWIGVMNRLPAAQRTKVWAGVITAAYVGAQWDLDPLDYLGVPVGDETEDLFGRGAASDLTGVVGMNLKDFPLAGPYLNELLQESPAMQWLNELNGGEVFPAGVPMPLLVTAADSPFVDLAESLLQGVEAGSQGRADRMEEVLGRALNRAVVPRTVELIRKAIDTEENPGGGYDYTPLFGTRSTRLWDSGLAQVWKDFLPGQVLSSAVQHEAISRSIVAAERERNRSRDLGEELVRTMGRLGRLDSERGRVLKEHGIEDDYYDAMFSQDVGDLGEFLEQHRDKLGAVTAERAVLLEEMGDLYQRATLAGKPIDKAKETEATKRAVLRRMGLRQLELAVYRAPSKAQKVEQLVKWIENPHTKLTPEIVQKVELVLGGMGPPKDGQPAFDYWISDRANWQPPNQPTVPMALVRRYYKAKEARLTPQ